MRTGTGERIEHLPTSGRTGVREPEPTSPDTDDTRAEPPREAKREADRTMIDRSAKPHRIERFRREPKRRSLVVDRIEDLGPRMRRIAFVSPDLADFDSRAPDDHIKVFVADPSAEGKIVMRDYTPRLFDRAARRLTIDFTLHDDGAVTAWARTATVGARLDIGGPRGSMVVPDDFDWYLLVGDETALPAIGRRVEELRPGVAVTTIVVVDGPDDVQTFETAADHRPVWVFRRDLPAGGDLLARDAAALRDAIEARPSPEGEGYAWIAAEARVARTLRDHLLEVRHHPRAWLKAAGYWVAGSAGASDKFDP